MAKKHESDQLLQDIGHIIATSPDIRRLTDREVLKSVKRLAWELKMNRAGWYRCGGWMHTTAVNKSGFLTVDEETADLHYLDGTTPPPF